MTTGLDVTPHGYPGAAIPSSLINTIGPSDTTIQLNSLSGWAEVTTGQPLGSSAAYILAIDYGLSNEEKVLVPAYQTGTVLNDVVRGYDNTLPTTHNAVAVVAPVWSASDAAASNAAVQSISNLGGRGTNPTPTDIEVGGAGTGQPGTSSFAAAADHSHPISTDTINGAINSVTVQGLQQKPYAWANNASDTTPTVVSPVYPTGGHVAGTCASVTGVTGYTMYLVTITCNLFNQGTSGDPETPWIGYGFAAGGTFQDQVQVTGISFGNGLSMTAQFIYSGTPTDTSSFYVLVAKNRSGASLEIYGSSISVVGLS